MVFNINTEISCEFERVKQEMCHAASVCTQTALRQVEPELQQPPHCHLVSFELDGDIK